MDDDNKNDALIGKIYETALSPGDWVDLLDTIAGWTEGRPESEVGGNALESPHTPGDVDKLIGHLERAVRSSAYMHALEDRSQVLNAMYNQMPWPMLMLGDSMQVIECNPVATQVLADGPVQLREDGSLIFSDRELKQ
ncbi:MAG: alpha/beta hydrolase, partial [Pseudomonadota bacterium]|nr:alpha/beta hydrolase [Pseudomonadota bacterium]